MIPTKAVSDNTYAVPTIPDNPLWPQQMRGRTVDYMIGFDSCSQSVLWSLMQALKIED